jgi:4-diphosphocytidyl-2C-methyl-D-erythritol kinase
MYFLLSTFFKFLLSVSFHEKLNMFKLIWDDEYHKLNSFFQTISIHHHLIYRHSHEQKGTVERHH